MSSKGWRQDLITFLSGMIPVIWLALLAAPYFDRGLFVIIEGVSEGIKDPINITFCQQTPRVILIFLGIYSFSMLCYFSGRRETRYGEDHGSARWGDPFGICAKLKARKYTLNRLFTQNVRISYDFFRHHRNINTTVVGGSGAIKTRGYVMNNICQNNCSTVCLDPMGEILRGCGNLLEEEGTEVRVLDLIEMEKSLHYNPFVYMRNEDDVQMLITYLFTATTPKDAKGQDPFWDSAAEMLLLALSFYLWKEAPVEEQTFAMVMELLRCAAIEDEEDSSAESITDVLFRELEERDPTHIAVRYYRNYRSGSGKTLKSIQLVLAAHLEKFNLSSLIELTSSDELDLRSLGEKKVALFLRISDTNKSYNFLISMLYSQIIQQLFEAADLKYHGALPVHVHFMMDEAANVKLPDDLESYISTARKRNVSISLILQNLTQLKSQFKDNWESIIGNCDEFLYLGGNEQSTHKFVSEQLGKQTIWTQSTSLSNGRNGHFSRNDQTTSRDLMTPDEVRMLDNDYCILLIRGFRPIKDRKLNITRHPKVKRTLMGGGKPYIHHRPSKAVTYCNTSQPTPDGTVPTVPADILILTEAEIEAMLQENAM